MIAAAYFVSAASHGLTYDNIVECVSWLALAVFALVCQGIRSAGVKTCLRAFAWIGAACGLIAMIAYAYEMAFIIGSSSVSKLPSLEMVNTLNERLQFTMQYANAAGLWFLVSSVVCALFLPKKWRLLAIAPMYSLVLTQSMSSIALALAAVVIICVWRVRRAEVSEALLLLVQASISFALAVFSIKFSYLSASCLGVLFLAFCYDWIFGLSERLRDCDVSGKWLMAASALACVLGVGLSVLVFRYRIAQSLDTLTERFVQVYDALGQLMAFPFLGIGPGAWAQLYPFVQSAQYDASIVHCSYMQAAMDAGLVGLALLLAFMAVPIVKACKAASSQGWAEEPFCMVVVLCCVAVHAAVDFDLQFLSILMLFVFFASLVIPAEAHELAASHKRAPGIVAAMGVTACAGVIVLAFSLQVTSSQVRSALYAGEQWAVDTALAKGSLGEKDPAVNERYCEYLANKGDAEAVLEYAQDHDLSMIQAFDLAEGLYSMGEDSHAEDMILSCLESQPYNTQAFRHAEDSFIEHGISDSGLARYTECVDRSNRLANQGNAALLPQMEFDVADIEGVDSEDHGEYIT